VIPVTSKNFRVISVLTYVTRAHSPKQHGILHTKFRGDLSVGRKCVDTIAGRVHPSARKCSNKAKMFAVKFDWLAYTLTIDCCMGHSRGLLTLSQLR
jgi:hypothetical protein